MSFGAPYDAKEQVRQAIGITDLVGSYIALRRQGRGYVGRCPWHDDSRPSLQVNPDRQSWKCWVCDIGGDIFSFVMRREGLEFREALQMLADRAGIALKPQSAQANVRPGSPDDKRTLLQALAWAEQQFHRCLLEAPEAESARRYLDQRGIDEQSIERFHLGFAPDSWQWLVERARETSFSPAVLEAAGLAARSGKTGRHYDRFRGRVMFSIRDTQQRPVAFGGRILPQFADEKSAKYINSPETRLFSKSEQLYGLDVARDAVSRQRHAVVMEGYTDVIVAHQFGVETAVAVLGTALTTQHVQLLRRFSDTITLVLDGDEAGQRRTNEILELFVAADVDLRILTLPEGLDPCDFLLDHGTAPFVQALSEATNALEHKIRIETQGVDLIRDTHRANQALENILTTLAKAPAAGSDQSRHLREDQMLVRLARLFQLDQTAVAQRLRELRRAAPAEPSAVREAASETIASPSLRKLNAQDRELLELLVQHEELADELFAAVPREQLATDESRSLYDLYFRLHQAGGSLQFERVMTEVEDPRLKNLLVQLDEHATEKAEQATQDARSRLHDLLQHMQRKQVESECRRTLAELEEKRFRTDEEEIAILLQLRQQELKRHGISAPTDG